MARLFHFLDDLEMIFSFVQHFIVGQSTWFDSAQRGKVDEFYAWVGIVEVVV
jgi:hypothetical protein